MGVMNLASIARSVRSTPRAALLASLACVLVPSAAWGQRPDQSAGIFFGTTFGGGVAWTEHPQVAPGASVGVVWDVVFGVQLSRRWTVGAMLTSWQTSPLGLPYHLHTFAPRVEWNPGLWDGLYVAGAAGLGMTDGDVTKRAGLGLSLAVGRRWVLTDWITLGLEAGALGHVYDDGTAFQPFVALHLRFHGRAD